MFGEGKNPTTQQQKKAVVFKPPLRFPAPGASPLHKIKQSGVCFISPPAAHCPGGCSGRRAELDTAALRPRAQGGGCRGTGPAGTPAARTCPMVGHVRFSCPFAFHEAAGASAGLCSPRCFLILFILCFIFIFSLSCQAAFPANCSFCAGSGGLADTRKQSSRSLLRLGPSRNKLALAVALADGIGAPLLPTPCCDHLWFF